MNTDRGMRYPEKTSYERLLDQLAQKKPSASSGQKKQLPEKWDEWRLVSIKFYCLTKFTPKVRPETMIETAYLLRLANSELVRHINFSFDGVAELFKIVEYHRRYIEGKYKGLTDYRRQLSMYPKLDHTKHVDPLLAKFRNLMNALGSSKE